MTCNIVEHYCNFQEVLKRVFGWQKENNFVTSKKMLILKKIWIKFDFLLFHFDAGQLTKDVTSGIRAKNA